MQETIWYLADQELSAPGHLLLHSICPDRWDGPTCSNPQLVVLGKCECYPWVYLQVEWRTQGRRSKRDPRGPFRASRWKSDGLLAWEIQVLRWARGEVMYRVETPSLDRIPGRTLTTGAHLPAHVYPRKAAAGNLCYTGHRRLRSLPICLVDPLIARFPGGRLPSPSGRR